MTNLHSNAVQFRFRQEQVLSPHKQLLRYGIELESLEKRGEGAYGAVYFGHVIEGDGRAKIPCAIKIYTDVEVLGGPNKRHMAEIGSLVSLNDSNHVVGLKKVVIEDGFIALIVERCEESFADLLKQHQVRHPGSGLPRDECYALFEQVARGLSDCHQDRLWHGDVKPSNMLINRRGYAKLCDFGTARVQQSPTLLTSLGRTAEYSKKKHREVLTKDRDIFGFAVSFAELRLGRHPFSNNDPDDGKLDLTGLDSDEITLIKPVLEGKEVDDDFEVLNWFHQIGTSQVGSQDKHHERAYCPDCGGTGRIRLANSGGVMADKTCPRCDPNLRELDELAQLFVNGEQNGDETNTVKSESECLACGGTEVVSSHIINGELYVTYCSICRPDLTEDIPENEELSEAELREQQEQFDRMVNEGLGTSHSQDQESNSQSSTKKKGRRKRKKQLGDWSQSERNQASYLVLKHMQSFEEACRHIGKPGQGGRLKKYLDARVKSAVNGVEDVLYGIECAGDAVSLDSWDCNDKTKTPQQLAKSKGFDPVSYTLNRTGWMAGAQLCVLMMAMIFKSRDAGPPVWSGIFAIGTLSIGIGFFWPHLDNSPLNPEESNSGLLCILWLVSVFCSISFLSWYALALVAIS